MYTVGAVPGVPMAQLTQAAQVMKPLDRDGDLDRNKPDPAVEQVKSVNAVSQHRLDVAA